MRDVYNGDPANFGYAVTVVDPTGSVKPRKTGENLRTYDIVGPLCFAGDVLARDFELPDVVERDWLVFSGTGANTFGLWSRHCSRTIPKVVASRGQSCELWSDRRPV